MEAWVEGKFGSTTCGSEGDGTVWEKEVETTDKKGRMKQKWGRMVKK